MLDMVITQEQRDELPEAVQAEYKPREGSDGGFQLDVQGTYSTADRDALQRSLQAERGEHRTTKDKYRGMGDVTIDQVETLYHKVQEQGVALEQSGNSTDQIEAAATRLADARTANVVRPLERKVAELTTDNEGLIKERDGLKSTISTAAITATVLSAFGAKAVGGIADARPDVEMWSGAVFEVNADGKVVSRDVYGVTPGLSPKEVFTDMTQRGERAHWFAKSKGGDARTPGKVSAKDNPFTLTNGEVKNLTKAALAVRDDPEGSKRLVEAAGAEHLFPSLFRE